MTPNEVAAAIMEHLCTHDYHGYSQGARWGDGEGACTLSIDGTDYQVEQGDRDCSSAIIDAYEAAGVDCGGATYTGNMRGCMCGTGNFEWLPMSYTAQRGDVYLNEVNHTAMCTNSSPDTLAEFSISENGGIYGEVGDQTGYESHIRGYYDYPWDGILRYVGNEQSAPPPPSGGVPPIHLQAVLEDGAVLPATTWPDYAGRGDAPIAYLAAWCEWPLDVQAYTANGWLPALTNPRNIEDLDNGCVGDGSPIMGIKMYLTSPGECHVAAYQVTTVDNGYYPAQRDHETSGGQDGYAGDLVTAITEVKARVEGY